MVSLHKKVTSTPATSADWTNHSCISAVHMIRVTNPRSKSKKEDISENGHRVELFIGNRSSPQSCVSHGSIPKNRLSLARHDPRCRQFLLVEHWIILDHWIVLSTDCNKQPIPGKIIHRQMEPMQLLGDSDFQ